MAGNPLPKSSRNTGQLRRLSSVDATVAREVLAYAFRALEPEEQTQRQLFNALMPELYALRTKGFTFSQITGLLNDAGFQLQVGTVKNYYYEMLDERRELCEQRFTEELLILHEVQQADRTTKLPEIVHKVVAIRSQGKGRQEAAISTRVNQALSVPDSVQGAPAEALTENTGKVSVKRSSRPPDQPKPKPEATETDGTSLGAFSELMTPPGSEVDVKPGGGFFAMGDDAEPLIPQIAEPQSAGSIEPSDHPTKWSCAPLKEGTMMLDRRPGVPPEVYENVILEHPAIPGLMLTKEQRLCGHLLELWNDDGVVFMETIDQKRSRIKWSRPLPVGGSQEGFVPLHSDTLPSSLS